MRYIIYSSLFLSLALATACDEDEVTREREPDALPPGEEADGGSPNDRACAKAAFVDCVIDAMGGRDALLALTNERVEATGTRSDSFQARSFTEPETFAQFSYVRTAEMGADRLRIELADTTNFFVPQTLNYVDVIDGEVGFVDGVDGVLGGPPQSPASAARIAVQWKQTDLTSPVRILRRFLIEPATLAVAPDADFAGRAHRVMRLAGAGVTPALLFIDPRTFLPAKVELLEDRPPLGDTLIEVTYGDYRDVSGVKFPFEVSVRANGVEIQTEHRTQIEIDQPTDDDFFAVPEEFRIPFDSDFADFGRLTAQQALSFQYLGFPVDGYLDHAVTPIFAQVAPGVHLILGTIHHSLLIEMSDHLVLVEAPVWETRSETTLAEIKLRFPGKPIRSVVSTHFHHDHSGGIRHFAAEGGVTVYAGVESLGFYQRIFEAPHTVARDRFASNPAPVTTRGVQALETLKDGSRVVELHKIATIHANDMLAVFLPQEKVLFVADLFNPVAALAGQPGVAFLKTGAAELLGEIERLGLDVERIYGVHGDGTAGTMADLRGTAGQR